MKQNSGVRRSPKTVFSILALAATLGCSRQPAERPAVDPEVQDVAPPLDSALSTEADPQAKAEVPTFSGVLPPSFPKDAPTYVPGTLVDFGDGWVEFQTADPLATVRARYPSVLRGRGWSGSGERFSKGGRNLVVHFTDARPGTKIRVEY
jgi:hypothetical protein